MTDEKPEFLEIGEDTGMGICHASRAMLDSESATLVQRTQYWAGLMSRVAGYMAADTSPEAAREVLSIVEKLLPNIHRSNISAIGKES